MANIFTSIFRKKVQQDKEAGKVKKPALSLRGIATKIVGLEKEIGNEMKMISGSLNQGLGSLNQVENSIIHHPQVQNNSASAHSQDNSSLPQNSPMLSPEKRDSKKIIQLLPVYVDKFDSLVGDHGLERGSTVLISGGAGTGKTTFIMQSLYNGALRGERGIYISFEEEPEKIVAHMQKNFGWDIEGMEKKGLLAILKFDPVKVARNVEAELSKKTGTLKTEFRKLELPFKPDRIGVDSLSALSITFEDEENYRRYIRTLFEELEGYNSVNFVLSETEQTPRIYSKSGIEEFLADAVVVFYNLQSQTKRQNMMEILKLRSSKHERGMIPYTITGKGIVIDY